MAEFYSEGFTNIRRWRHFKHVLLNAVELLHPINNQTGTSCTKSHKNNTINFRQGRLSRTTTPQERMTNGSLPAHGGNKYSVTPTPTEAFSRVKPASGGKDPNSHTPHHDDADAQRKRRQASKLATSGTCVQGLPNRTLPRSSSHPHESLRYDTHIATSATPRRGTTQARCWSRSRGVRYRVSLRQIRSKETSSTIKGLQAHHPPSRERLPQDSHGQKPMFLMPS